jgi:hypothetical protein
MARPVSVALALGLALGLAACGGGDGNRGDRADTGAGADAGAGAGAAGDEPATTVPAAGGEAAPTSTPGPGADPSVPPTVGGPPATTRTGPLSTTPPPTAGYPDGPPRSPTDQVKARTLTGTVATAAGCLVIDTGSGRWALVGSALPANLASGARIEVTARPMPQAESPCGSPVLSVLTVTRL